MTLGGTITLPAGTEGFTVMALLGDANHDGRLSAADLVAIVLKIGDGDGNLVTDVGGGSFPGKGQARPGAIFR